jgi:cytochrome c biogenesis protein
LEEKEKTDVFEKIWNFFTSVKLTIVILIVLALTSIIGTIVEQRAEPAKNIALLAKFFGDSAAPTVYNIFVKFGFMDMYHSWWFISLLILFSTNLIVCSLERLPKTLRLINTPLKPLGENAIKSLPVKRELKIKASLKTAKDEILNSLTTARYRVFEATEEDSIQMYSQKGKYTRLGLYIVHLSIILIFIGAIIGARFGFGGFLNLPEGGASDVAYAGRGKEIPLGFTIKCNWYNTEYYEDERRGDIPKEFQSELVIIENGREVMKKVIEVNHPLTYKGVTFFQSSYGMIPKAVGELILKIIPKDGRENTLRLRFGETFEITPNIRGTIVNFSPALARDRETGDLYTYAETMANPAVAIEFDGMGERSFTGWILKRYPETGILPDGTQIKFEDYWGVEYTGLQVSKDPGVGLIYFACVIMTIGLYAAFFMSHKKIWIRLAPNPSGEKGFVSVSVGGSASKNRLSFEREIEKILSKASQAIEGRSKK